MNFPLKPLEGVCSCPCQHLDCNQVKQTEDFGPPSYEQMNVSFEGIKLMVLLSQSQETKKTTTVRNARIPKDSSKCPHRQQHLLCLAVLQDLHILDFNLYTRG